MTWLLPTLVVTPLAAAAATLVAGRRLIAQRVVTVAAIVAVAIGSLALVAEVDRVGALVSTAGGWPAGIGITLIADRLAAIVLAVSALMLLAVLWFAIGQLGRDAVDWWFHTKYLVLSAGVVMSLLTGDLFNLFVGFEVMLVASYMLVTVRSDERSIRSVLSYVVINLIASVLFLVAIGFVYGTTGTMNLAEIASRLADVDEGSREAINMLLLVVFGIKAGLFPLFMWLPDSYPTAPTPVTAVFAGLLTKVGVFLIIRLETLLFPDRGPSTFLLFIAGATMLVGVLGAIAQNDIKRILSFHIVSQIGYMMMGLGFLTAAGLAAAMLYITHHIVVKTGLFLVAGLVEAEYGDGGLDSTGGLLHRRPVVALLFVPLAFSLAGLPPFSGFVAKFALVQEGIAAGRWIVVGVSLIVSLLTLLSMTKIWGATFWGEERDGVGRSGRSEILVTGLVVALSIGVALSAGPLADFAGRAAADLLDPSIYIHAVLGR